MGRACSMHRGDVNVHNILLENLKINVKETVGIMYHKAPVAGSCGQVTNLLVPHKACNFVTS
jgi:hypothetical protein